jgi:hypothetical protein
MMMRFLRFFLFIALVIAISFPTRSAAQVSTVPARITEPMDEMSRTRLYGNVSAAAKLEYDRGHASASTQLSHMRIVLSRSAEQQAALDKFEEELQDKSSANYHKWLTPDQFGKLYGPADSDIAAIVAWLQSHGLTVDSVSPGRTNIAFSGYVSQIEETLHTEIHSFEIRGEQFYSNTSDPTIPSALAPVIQGIAHLNTLRPKPQYVRGKAGVMNPVTRKVVALAEATPGYTGANGAFYVVPADAATIYDSPSSTFNANYKTGTTYDGTGVTIGIGGDAVIKTSTVIDYRSRYLGNKTAPVITNVDSVTSTSDTDEAYIDTEISGGLAPGAKIHFYTSTDLNSGIEQAINENTVDIFSLSFLECEQDLSTADNAVLNSYWQQAAAQGIAVTVATGDSGSAGCDLPMDGNNYVLEAVNGLKVNGYASTPYNVAVGGTDFYPLTSSWDKYIGSTETKYFGDALGYIPESTWNDSTSNDTTISNDSPTYNIIAGGGGSSSCSTNTTQTSVGNCTSGYSKPSWQRGTGVPADGVRDLPDVALMAGNGNDNAMWLVCDDATTTSYINSSTVTMNCTKQPDGQYYNDGFGGTSTSAPAFAGILALVEQSVGGRLGQAATQLYNLYNGSHASQIFHDVTIGNNSVPCTAGTPNCKEITSEIYYESGYNAASGYDLATGLGSVDAAQLINYWDTASSGEPATVSVSANQTSITTAQSLSLAVTVAGSGSLPTPTGTVTLSGGGYTSTTEPLTSGAYTFTIPAGSLTTGTDTFTVTYSGDANYASTTGTTSVTVTAAPPTVTLTLSSATISANQSLQATATVSGTGATPTGTVVLSGGSYTSPAQTLSSRGTYVFTVPGGTLSPGTYTLSVTYSGDNNYTAGTATVSVKVTTAVLPTPTVTVTPASTTILSTQSLNLTTTVAGTGGTPTGTVTLSGGGYDSPAQTLSNGSATFAIPANSLALGTDTFTVTYSGDANFASSTGTATVMVSAGTVSTFAISATTPLPIAAGATATSGVTVTGSGDYSGAVSLTCALTSSPAGAVNPPSCSIGPSSVVITSATTTGTTTATVSTTAPSTASLRLGNSGWFKTAGGTVTLGLLLFFVPGRWRKVRKMLSVLVLVSALGFAAVGCGGTASPSGVGTTKTTPTVTVKPASNSISANDSVLVAVAVAGSGTSAPTGTATLTSGSYSSSAVPVSSGAASITIPASSLAVGTDTLTVDYSGDSNYNSATGTSPLTVTSPVVRGGTTAGTYTFTVTGTGNDASKTTMTANFTVTVN